MLTRCSLPVGLGRYVNIPVCNSISVQSSYCVTCIAQMSLGSQNFSSHIFLRNHKGQLPDIWHRASVWRTVQYRTVSNLLHLHFLFDGTQNIFEYFHVFLKDLPLSQYTNVSLLYDCKNILQSYNVMSLSSSVCKHNGFHPITFIPVDRFP